jgi:molybdopterin molybdotransferase
MKLLTVEDARARMLAAVTPMPAETVALGGALGRTLVEPVLAKRDQPPFEASAMDGWAVRASDAATGETSTLRVVGESAAGHGYAAALLPGEAVRIFTGAPVPAGADRVVIQEESERDGDLVRLTPAGEGRNIRRRGGDFRKRDVLLEPGVRLDPWRVALAAAAGEASLQVARRPRVALLTTGEELTPAGDAPGAWSIFDSGSPALAARAAQWGAEVSRYGPARDDIPSIVTLIERAQGDLIVTVGGASVGDHDLVRPAFERLGLELLVGSVKVRPGKPTWFGRLSDGRLVLGLPGNPASALVCAELFLFPLLMRMQGADATIRIIAARLAHGLPANGPREHWMRARLRWPEGAPPIVEAYGDQDSSLVTVFAAADALLRRSAGAGAAEAGEWVEALPLGRL